jgi:hypothetical protein
MTDKKEQYIHEGLGLTNERAEELFEVVDEQLKLDTDIASRLEFLRYTGWTPNEDAFALFMFGYGIREIELMNETVKAIEKILGAVVNDEGI